MGLLLYIIARILQWVLTPLFYLYAIIRLHNLKKISLYFGNVAFSLDQLGNVMGAPIMNDVLLKNNPVKLYGNPDETISHVTSVNYFSWKLTFLGKTVAKTLDSIDKNHMKKAFENEQ